MSDCTEPFALDHDFIEQSNAVQNARELVFVRSENKRLQAENENLQLLLREVVPICIECGEIATWTMEFYPNDEFTEGYVCYEHRDSPEYLKLQPYDLGRRIKVALGEK